MSQFNLAARKAELREAFDQTFASPAVRATSDIVDLLVVRAAGVAYGVRLRELSGLVEGRKVVPLPNNTAHFLGVAGIRGILLPVFSLASILGLGEDSGTAAPNWLLVCGLDDPIGLGVSDFQGHRRLPSSAFHVGEAAKPGAFVAEICSTDSGGIPVVGITAVVAALREHSGRKRLKKEH